MLAYIKARAADSDGASVAAVRDYAAALAADPDSASVAVYAYREALDAGDFALADRAAATLAAVKQAPGDVTLLAVAKAAREKDLPGATRAIDDLAAGPLAILAPSLRAWLALDAGRDPMAPLTPLPKDLVARRFAKETSGLVLIAQGKASEGIAALGAILGSGQSGEDVRISAARLLISGGHKDLAVMLLAGETPAVAALRAKPGDGVKPSFAFGVSRLFGRIASDLAVGEPGPLSIALTRAALRADPGFDRARLLLADALIHRGALDRGLAVIDEVDRDGPFARLAAVARVDALAKAGQSAKALAAAESLAKDKDAPVADIRQYADLLLAEDRPAAAARAYRRVLDLGGGNVLWAAWLQYGGALDQAGRWPEARKALRKAVSLSPDEPLALNYLAYSELKRHENVAGAQAMLERAFRLRPDDSGIADSLGWAYYLQGDVAKALPLLERATTHAPGNPEIGEHLGDAYWSIGRRYEARYAWRAAALAAGDGDKTRLAAKIADGL